MRPEYYLYLSTFFSTWGDWMWFFSIGMYLVQITPGSLQLAAIFGLVSDLTAIIFSPVVGDWIDRNHRLLVVRVTLILQNSLVIICALVVLLFLYRVSDNPIVLEIFKVLIIITWSVANLAGQGEKIAVTKDWVIVVSRGSNDLLSKTNAIMRAIDLTVAIVAPLVVGILMSQIDNVAGVVSICIWNVISMFAEYFLLLKVYNLIPELRMKAKCQEETSLLENDQLNLCDKQPSNHVSNEEKDKAPTGTSKSPTAWDVLSRFKTIFMSWKVYYKQEVFLAGCALSMLFLTVINFGVTTTGFALLSGLNELYISISMGLGSMFGVLGTFLFPKIRASVGLPKTGLIGFLLQWTVLLLCAISVFLPGSPSALNQGDAPLVTIAPNVTVISNLTITLNATLTVPAETEPEKGSLISIIVLMVGIILSRTGLWITDLSITQLQQENVPEEERGIVGGVQYSLNCILDLVQFGLTIIHPTEQEFGYLILISVSGVLCSGIIYSTFLVRFLAAEKKKNAEEEERMTKERLDAQYGSINV